MLKPFRSFFRNNDDDTLKEKWIYTLKDPAFVVLLVLLLAYVCVVIFERI